MLDLGNLMRIILAYVCVVNGPITHDYAARFVGSYLANPPGVVHDTIVACNGGALPCETGLLFQSLSAKFYPRKNDPGYDLSAFQDVAKLFPCDLLVCCGESVYFHRADWLRRYVEVWNKYGPGMYGTFSSNLVRPHLNTTGFCVAPKFLIGSDRCQSREDRYEFEHGEKSLWRRVYGLGFPVRMVTWDGDYEPTQWRNPNNIMWRGDQSACLMRCQHTDRWDAASEETKAAWARNADKPFKWT